MVSHASSDAAGQIDAPGRYGLDVGLPMRPDPLPPWGAQAACIGHDPRLWFITRGGQRADPAAVAVCATCPVQMECLDWAMEHDEEGVWAGLLRAERRSLWRHPSRHVPVVDS